MNFPELLKAVTIESLIPNLVFTLEKRIVLPPAYVVESLRTHDVSAATNNKKDLRQRKDSNKRV